MKHNIIMLVIPVGIKNIYKFFIGSVIKHIEIEMAVFASIYTVSGLDF